jgi:hypothetical protein
MMNRELEIDVDGLPYQVEVTEFEGNVTGWECGPSEPGYPVERGHDHEITHLVITVTFDDEPVSQKIHDEIYWRIWEEADYWYEWIEEDEE